MEINTFEPHQEARRVVVRTVSDNAAFLSKALIFERPEQDLADSIAMQGVHPVVKIIVQKIIVDILQALRK